jgi:hypothetical protein
LLDVVRLCRSIREMIGFAKIPALLFNYYSAVNGLLVTKPITDGINTSPLERWPTRLMICDFVNDLNNKGLINQI